MRYALTFSSRGLEVQGKRQQFFISERFLRRGSLDAERDQIFGSGEIAVALFREKLPIERMRFDLLLSGSSDDR